VATILGIFPLPLLLLFLLVLLFKTPEGVVLGFQILRFFGFFENFEG
jgi:hypothetical protein